MTPRLTRADATLLYSRLKHLLAQGMTLPKALQELLSVVDVMELLECADSTQSSLNFNTVMEMARHEAGTSYSREIDHLAQELHRRIINALGDIHITHYFVTHTIHEYQLTPAQAWLITIARDLSYVNSRTGERRDVVTFKQGYQEMAELVGSSRYKTVQAWFRPQWEKQCRGGDMTRFLMEQNLKDTGYSDLRVDSMPRSFRVLLDEPLDANGSISVDAGGSNSGTRLGVVVDASGSNMVDANGTALNSLKHPLNASKENTSSGAAPAFWELKSLLQQNNVHRKVQRELLESQASVRAFVSWTLFVASSHGCGVSDPLGYVLSQLRQDPLAVPRGSFRQFASLPPAELLVLIDSTLTQRYEFIRPIQHPLTQAWKKAMGSHNSRLSLARDILFGERDSE